MALTSISGNKRFRLDLTDCEDIIESQSYHPLCWILINTLKIAHVKQFKKEIQNRYRISTEDEFSLYVDNAFVSDNEPLDILREGDIVKVVPCGNGLLHSEESKKRKASGEVEILDNSNSSVIISSKRSKKRHNNDTDVSRDIISSNVLPQTSCKQPKKDSNEVPFIESTKTDSLIDVEKRSTKKRKKKISKNDESNCQQSLNNIKAELSGESHMSVTKIEEEITVNLGSDSFNEEIIEPKSKRVRKRRKRNRKVKTEPDGIFSSTPLIDLEANPFKSNSLSAKVENGTIFKHIRFETPKALEDKAENDSRDTLPLNNTSYLTSNETNSVSQWPSNCETPLPSTSGDSKLRDKLLEMSKTMQINSKLENHSVILLNCENTEPNLLKGMKDDSNTIPNFNSPIFQVHTSSPAKKLPKSKNWTPLVGPPRVGDIIAYKVLELSETYCPEVSKFKTAKVVGYEASEDTLKLEILSQEIKSITSGKFDIVDDEESEIKISEEILVDIKWLDLIEPKLIS